MSRATNDFSSRADLRDCLDRAAGILLKNSKAIAGIDKDRTVQRKTRLALLRLASLIRRRWKESFNAGTRVELRTFLENLKRSSDQLSNGLSDQRLVKALQLPPQKEEIRHNLHEFLNVRLELINTLMKLSSSLPNVVNALQLSGKEGRSGPFHTVQVPAKVLASIYGRKIFTELGLTKRPPSARHGKFVDFSDCVWMLATNGSEVEGDWSTPVKVAALQRETGIGPGAHTLARLEAADFARDLRRDLGLGR